MCFMFYLTNQRVWSERHAIYYRSTEHCNVDLVVPALKSTTTINSLQQQRKIRLCVCEASCDSFLSKEFLQVLSFQLMMGQFCYN